ncbi:hypothetical protein [Nonomuraea sediminis]|uniref:hypothetical protein n=1 Tax=Nonomuraea sediminis TaxID=2835864 RepID=UPI001BDC056E|nr:hypothetical protein [Nonomuraea sediminis]
MKPADHLARLLSDTRGAEILAELQKVMRGPGVTTAPEPSNGVGVWDTEATDEGVALRRRENTVDWWRWADVPYVPPPAGRRRVALVGESVARGWLLEPGFTPAQALGRLLADSQVVDLARSNIDIWMLRETLHALPSIEPDVVVLFAGNNFTFAPLDDGYRDVLAAAVRRGGYPEMRRTYVENVILPEVDLLLEDLARLRDTSEIVLVVPESNLAGWTPAAEIEVPVLPEVDLRSWYLLRSDALAALAAGDWDRAAAIAARMVQLDRGLSPVSWHIKGQAALGTGAGAQARDALERARDATPGLLLDHVSGVITPIRRRLLDFAAAHGVRHVDAARALSWDRLPELPDPACFLDHIHLSDEGIERVMAQVVDAIAELPPGSTPPGQGASPRVRALGRSLAAGYRALREQPADAVREQLELALAADSEGARQVIERYLDVLETPGPRWTHPALADLHADPQTRQVCYQIAQTREHSSGYWTFRDVVQEVLGRRTDPETCRWQCIDLLGVTDGRAFRAPNFVPGKAYYEATKARTTLHMALAAAEGGWLRLVHRLPSGTAWVSVNGVPVGELPQAATWCRTALQIPAAATREGVNSVEIAWPVPKTAYEDAVEADASALARRLFPRMLPVFGALYTATFESSGARGDEEAVRASRVSASTGWKQPVEPAK